MTTKMKALMAMALVTTLTACERAGVRTYDADRSESDYRAAMADYSAGRMEAALKGLDKAVAANPINAAARFQLACLLQDVRHDPLAAYVEYQAFLRIDPKGDKAKIADDRAKLCLKAMETSALKGSAGADAKLAGELEAVRKESEVRRNRITGLERDLADARLKVAEAERENKRLRTLMDGLAVETEEPRKNVSREAELFGSDDENQENDMLAEARELERIAKAEDAANGRESDLLPKQSVDAKAKRDAKKQSAKPDDGKKKAPIERPSTYRVAEGDTLYRLAQRFYGQRGAWTRIRDANREKISNDCKLRVGDVIRLP